MTAIVVEDNNTRAQDMEGAVSGTTNIGAGPGPNTFLEAIYQGAQTWGRKIGATSSLRGFHVAITSIDMTVADNKVVMWKASLVNSAAIDPLGLRARIGSGVSGAYYQYIIHDDGTQGAGEFQYPIKDAWIIVPIDPNVEAWRDSQNSFPTLTAIISVAFAGAITITTTNENMIVDAIDFSAGLFLTRGDGGDTDGIFQDFVDDDEGTVTAGRFGHYSTRDGIIFTFGKTVIGRTSGGSTANATEFTDELRTLVFPGGLVDAGWNELELDCTNANTLITLNNIVVEGRGRDNLKRYFDSELQVDGALEEIDIPGHSFATGDLIIASDEGNTMTGGLGNNQTYFVRRIDADTIALYLPSTSLGRRNSFDDTSRVNITAASAGNGMLNSLRRKPDTRPDITVTGAGASATADLNACILTNFRQITLTSVASLLDCVLTNGFNIDIDTGAVDGCTINSFILGKGEAAITASTLVGIDDNIFIMNTDTGGHAVEIDAVGTFGYVGNAHTGYGPGTASDAGIHDHEFDTTTDVNAATDTITLVPDNFVTGDPVYYSDEGGTANIGLIDGKLYFVERDSAGIYGIFESLEAATTSTNRIALTSTGGETHVLYSADAAIHNSSGGTVTVQVSGGGDTPSVRNSAGSTTNIENNVALTLSGMKDNTEVRVYTAGTTTELAGVENATDGTTDNRSVTFSLAAGLSVDIRFMNQDWIVPDRNSFTIFTWPTTTTNLPVTQVFDRTFDNPV